MEETRLKSTSRRVLLLEPFWPPEEMWGVYAGGAGLKTFPQGLAIIAASLIRAGHQVATLNPTSETMTEPSLRSWLQERAFDVVAIPCYTPSANRVFQTARLARATMPSAKILLGGPHATVLPRVTMEECPEADYLLAGEAEVTILALLDALDTPETMASIPGL